MIASEGASPLLGSINSPADVKKLSIVQLRQLAEEIRQELITILSKNGGHLGPNLGVVELTLALHYVFNTPEDHFLFDVSHQCYVHKLLTGRRERFPTIRQQGGLSGFMLRSESPHDAFGAGHAGTAVSAALGMAVARDLRGGKEHVIALAGDAAFTCGVTFEGLNNVAHRTKRMIIILNDNEWSIDKNVGAVAKIFNNIVTNPNYSHLHEKAAQFLERIGGKQVARLARRTEGMVKSLLLPCPLFEDLGLTYYGPVDGHDLPSLIHSLEFLKTAEHPVLLHAITKKGKGFEPAQEETRKFHGVGPYHPETGETRPNAHATYSEIFGDTLAKMAETNQRIVAITGAMPTGTGLDRFQAKHPNRYFDVGIAEEHAVLFAAGMATKGMKPFCALYSTFMQRAFDIVIHDVCLQNLPVVLCMDRGSLSGDDGPTHHGLFDISFLRSVPNIVHMSPKDEDEFVDMLHTAAHHPGPVALRYPRGMGPGTKIKEHPELIPIGKAEVIQHGQQIAIWSYGAMLPMARQLADELQKQGYSTAIINARFAKPLDVGTLEFFGRSADLMFTLEDHVLKGGFGSAVLEELQDLGLPTPVVRVGWPDEFIEHGKVDALREKYGLSVSAALAKAEPYLKKMKAYHPSQIAVA
ncbi:MAG: 1-deoxy-D-xylulose-5-phosphate synthase [bacterium]